MKSRFKLNILTTSDIHGYLLPINYADNTKSSKGLSILASAIKTFNRNNSILLDIGDSIQGNPLMYFHQLNRSKYINPVAKLFNKIGYDYFIPGNHDFNYGKKYLKDFIKQINAKTLCQNIYKEDHLVFKKGYDIKEFKNGPKILIIGATTKYIPNWENPKNIRNYTFRNPIEEVKNIINKHKNKVDLIILAYHGGFEKDILTGEEFVKDTGENQGYRLFKEIPDIDILLTGHQHRVICHKDGNRVIIQPGSNGSHLGVIEVEFSYERKHNVNSTNPYFLLAKDYVADIDCVNAIQKIEADNQKFLDEVIGIVSENNLEIKDPFIARRDKHPIVDFINKIQLDASHAMLSSTSLANIVTGFNKEITVRNVLSTYIFTNTPVVVEINGLLLKKYLEKCAEYFILIDGKITHNPRFSYPKVEHYNYDMVDGIDYIIDLRKEFGNRIVSIKYKGKQIKESDKFSLVINNYRATGGGDFYMLKDLPVIKEIPFDIAELMINYIRTQKFLKIKEKKNIILLK
ncbi:bifunctional UDP-sugar hydrolase/5'-nucleotidase [Mycoplasmatota bacterium WC30]